MQDLPMESAEPEKPKVGETLCTASWRDLECRAVIVAVDEYETFARLDILLDGAVQWSSPRVDSSDHDWAFGYCDYGSAQPCLFEDIDGDGKPELLALVPKNDMSPRGFRVFRWTGHELVFLRRALLIRDAKDKFAWTEDSPEDLEQVAWIDFFLEDGTAEIIHQRKVTVSCRTARVKPVSGGFVEVEQD